MKFLICFNCFPCFKVAPFAGAWIEIVIFLKLNELTDVAPFAGAWIEIIYLFTGENGNGVAPFAGAWIEIEITKRLLSAIWSLPSRERGLKSYNHISKLDAYTSLPSRERGLKSYQLFLHNHTFLVAPFAGAWIEIL